MLYEYQNKCSLSYIWLSISLKIIMNNDNQYYNSNMTNQNVNMSSNNPSMNVSNNIPPKKSRGFAKYIVIGLILLAIAAGVFFFIKGRGSNKSVTKDLGYKFDPSNPIVIKKDGKYGYITSEGEVMIEPQYKSAGKFEGDYAIVQTENPDTSAYNETVYQVIDKSGNVKVSVDYSFDLDYISEYNLWVVGGKLYDGKFNQLTGEEMTVSYLGYGYFSYTNYVKEESGIMNSNRKTIFSWAGSAISVDLSDNEYTDSDYYAVVSIYEERYAVVSLKTGEIVYNLDDPKNKKLEENPNNIFKIYNADNYEAEGFLYFKDGKLAYEISGVYDLELDNYQDQILAIDYGYDYKKLGKSQRIYYYDLKNEDLLDKRPSTTTNIEANLNELIYGYRDYSCSSKKGIISGESVVIPCEYNSIKFLNVDLYNYMKQQRNQELAFLTKDKQTSMMNLKNKEVVTVFPSSYVSDYSGSTFIGYRTYDENGYTTKSYVVYNLLSGQNMEFDKESSINYYSNYITVTKNNKTTYYNTNFKEIYSVENN